LEVKPEHFFDLETLVQEYGWVGKGIKEVVGNRHIRLHPKNRLIPNF